MIGQNPNVPQSHPLKFRTIAHGSGGPKLAVNDVIDDREELEEYARDCTGETDRKAVEDASVDFTKAKVIGVALGSKPTAAYEVEVVAVVQMTGGFVGLQTHIHYVERAPTPATPPDALTLPGYPHHVVRVKNAGGLIVFRRVDQPTYTTLAVGEEDAAPPTTLATGEEGGDPTTLATGEEAGMHATTLAVGEEGGAPTTLAVGEEGGTHPTTLAVGEEGLPPPTESMRPTTMMIGEESGAGHYTTLAVGEEDTRPTTLAVGEEGGQATTLAVGEEDTRPTTLAVGEEGGGTMTTLAVGEESWGRGPFGGY